MAAIWAVLLIVFFALPARAETRTLALYSSHAGSLEAGSLPAVRNELQRLLTPAGIDVVWKDPSQRNSGEQFDIVVVGVFEGSCSADDAFPSPISPAFDPAVLADTSVSNGRVLPFFRIDCGQLLRTLAPAFKTSTPALRLSMVSRAVARVIAHEIYHVLAQTKAHDSAGIAKASFTLVDLTADRFDFDGVSLSQMQPAARPGFSNSAIRSEADGR
jgi:hypothetical protein